LRIPFLPDIHGSSSHLPGKNKKLNTARQVCRAV
jgi:hypothetical protein